MSSTEVGDQILDQVIWSKEIIIVLQVIDHSDEKRVWRSLHPDLAADVMQVLQMAILQQTRGGRHCAAPSWLGKWSLRFLKTVLVNGSRWRTKSFLVYFFVLFSEAITLWTRIDDGIWTCIYTCISGSGLFTCFIWKHVFDGENNHGIFPNIWLLEFFIHSSLSFLGIFTGAVPCICW